ncbi:MAG TPA: RICIN domain-containing protein [Solimonas sp.]|nr:RICIN domain-containing protein [Solimonas sp.]
MKIQHMTAAVALMLMLPAAQAVAIPAGRYLIKPAHSNLCLDINGGGQLAQKTCSDNNTAQQFDIAATNGGWSKISSASSGYAVQVSGGSTAENAVMNTAGYGGSNQQQFMFLKNGGGYVLKARHSGKCADLKDWIGDAGGLLQQLTCSGGGNQTFVLQATAGASAPIAEGRYSIRAVHSNLCLDVPNSSTANGTQLRQYTCNGTGAQQYDIYYVGNSRYEVRNVTSGRCVDLYSGWTVNGTAVQQYDCNQTNAQRWFISGIGDGSVQFKSTVDSTKVWDVSNVSTASGANVWIWGNGQGANQRWWLNPVVYAPTVADGTYSLKNLNSGKCLDVPNASSNAGVQIQQYSCNGGTAQRFSVSHMANGYYRIVNASSGLSLHIASFLVGDNAALLQNEAHGGDNELFTFVAYGGGYLVKPLHSYKCLDVPGASLSNGALLQQYTCNQSNAQVFQLQ